MKRIYRILLLSLSILGLGMLFVGGVSAQSPFQLRAEVDATEITTDDTVTLTLTLTTPDGAGPRLDLPNLEGFTVVGTQTASQYNVINGSASASRVYAFALRPTKTGTLVIPALNLDMNGQLLRTDPLTVNVTQGNGTPTRRSTSRSSPLGGSMLGNSPFRNSMFSKIFGNDPFDDPFNNDDFGMGGELQLHAATDKESVYVGEPVQYTVRVASDAMLLGEPEYEQPTFTGFWAHQPPTSRQGMNGSEITTLLFPTQAGDLTIEPATIRAAGGFFSNPLERETDPVTIQVKPLPKGAPAEFNGAVGHLAISAEPDKTTTRVGDPITVRVELKGTTNFDTLPDPNWPEDSNWRAMDAKGETSSQVLNGTLAGTRIFERILIPTQAGTLTIPAVKYAYFDPATEQYQVIETKPISVQVAPGDPNVVGNTAGQDPAAEPDNSGAAPSEISALKAGSTPLTTAAAPLATQPLFLALFLVPLGVVAIDLALGWRKNYLTRNGAQLRASRALKHALKQLNRVKADQYAAPNVAAVVQAYLEDKLNRSLHGVPHSTIAQMLAVHKLPTETNGRLIGLLHLGESTEFGTPVASRPQLLTEASSVLQQTDKEWVS